MSEWVCMKCGASADIEAETAEAKHNERVALERVRRLMAHIEKTEGLVDSLMHQNEQLMKQISKERLGPIMAREALG